MLWASVMACVRIVVEALTNIAVGWWHRPYDRVIEMTPRFSSLAPAAHALGFPSLQFERLQLS